MRTSPWVKCCIFISVSKWTLVAHVMKAWRVLRAKTALSRLMATNPSCPDQLLVFWLFCFVFGLVRFGFFTDYFLNLLFKTRVQQEKRATVTALCDPPHSLSLYNNLHAVFIPVCCHPTGWFVASFVHVSYLILMISILVCSCKME